MTNARYIFEEIIFRLTMLFQLQRLYSEEWDGKMTVNTVVIWKEAAVAYYNLYTKEDDKNLQSG
jgi:hypothetical protein